MKTMNTLKLLAATLIASGAGAMLTLDSGCIAAAGVAVGAGAVAYVDGTYSTHLGNDYEHVVNATEAAIPQLQMMKIDESRDALKAKFTARTTDDKKVSIEVTRESNNLAKVEIRVGTLGDKDKSAAILDRIKANL